MTDDKVPPEVDRFLNTLRRLPGLRDVESSIQVLEDVPASDLRFIPFSRLPIGALRRTDGGLPGEALLDISFRVHPSAEAWRSLEFIAWWVTDQARGGEFIQLRAVGLPPVAGESVQLGHTLEFHIDLFRIGETERLQPHLDKIAELAQELEALIGLYNGLLRERGSAPLTLTEA